MANLILFGAYLSDLELDDDDGHETLSASVYKLADESQSVALARIYGMKAGAACVSLPKPLVMWMPAVSAPAQDCGFSAPVRAWAIAKDAYDAATAKSVDALSDGIQIGIEDLRVEDGWILGVVRLKVKVKGVKLADVGLPFKTKSDVTLLNTGAAGFKLTAVLGVASFDPPQVCVTVTIKGPLGYKDRKRVCS